MDALRYVPPPADVTRRVTVGPLPSGDLFCADLEARTLVLDRALAIANARLAAAECLGHTIPESTEATACIDALEKAIGD